MKPCSPGRRHLTTNRCINALRHFNQYFGEDKRGKASHSIRFVEDKRLGTEQNQDPKIHNGIVMDWAQQGEISQGSLEDLFLRAGWPAINIQSTLSLQWQQQKSYSVHVNNFWPMKCKQEYWVKLSRKAAQRTDSGGRCIPLTLQLFLCIIASDGLKEFV